MTRRRGRWPLGALVALAGCAVGPAMPGSDDDASGAGGKSDYYGNDDRVQIEGSPDPRALGWSRAAAVMGYASALLDRGDGFLSAQAPTLGERYGLCSDERFVTEPSFGFCSAFLIEPDVVVTAGHCIDSDTCGNVAFVFDFQEGGASADIARIPRDRVYSCASILARENEWAGRDYAVVRLDRSVSDRAPLRVQSEAPPVSAGVALLGFPHGVLAKIDTAGRVVDRGPIRIVTSLDSFKAHSGAAVLDLASGRVFAVHVAGSDANFESDGACSRPVGCAHVTLGGAECIGSIEVLLSAAGIGGAPIDDPSDPMEPTDPMEPADPGPPVVDTDTPLCIGPGGVCAADADCAHVIHTCEGESLFTESHTVPVACDDGLCADLPAIARDACPSEAPRFHFWSTTCDRE